MGREHIGLTLATCCRDDDLDLGHFMPSHGIGLAARTRAISMSTSLGSSRMLAQAAGAPDRTNRRRVHANQSTYLT